MMRKRSLSSSLEDALGGPKRSSIREEEEKRRREEEEKRSKTLFSSIREEEKKRRREEEEKRSKTLFSIDMDDRLAELLKLIRSQPSSMTEVDVANVFLAPLSKVPGDFFFPVFFFLILHVCLRSEIWLLLLFARLRASLPTRLPCLPFLIRIGRPLPALCFPLAC